MGAKLPVSLISTAPKEFQEPTPNSKMSKNKKKKLKKKAKRQNELLKKQMEQIEELEEQSKSLTNNARENGEVETNSLDQDLNTESIEDNTESKDSPDISEPSAPSLHMNGVDGLAGGEKIQNPSPEESEKMDNVTLCDMEKSCGEGVLPPDPEDTDECSEGSEFYLFGRRSRSSFFFNSIFIVICPIICRSQIVKSTGKQTTETSIHVTFGSCHNGMRCRGEDSGSRKRMLGS
jgi:hypothetical protein